MKFLFGFTFLVLLGSCQLLNRWKTIKETIVDGEPFVLEVKETKGPSSNSLQWRFKLGALPYVSINAHTLDWGPPYSTKIYGSHLFDFISHNDTINTDSLNVNATTHTFLYLSPNQVSEEEFAIYLQFMKKHWAVIDQEFKGNSLRTFPHIIGLVHGKQIDFCKQFSGKLPYLGTSKEMDYVLEVKPDGRIVLSNKSSEEFSGLSDIKAPGNAIQFTPGNYSLAQLNSLKDKGGKSITDHFKITIEK